VAGLDDDNLLRALAGDVTLEPAQVIRYQMLFLAGFRLFEEFFYQHREGMLDASRWAAQVRRIRGFMTSRGYRAAWQVQAPSFEPDFAGFIDAIVHETPLAADPLAAVAAWRMLVQEAQP